MLEVIGAGFGRTGTLSLKHALEILGFGKCYHFREMLMARHARRWLKIATIPPERRSLADWERLFRGYRSSTDWPAAAVYKELADSYPQAKLILTVRDADDWYDSVCGTIRYLRLAMPERWPVFRSIADVSDRYVWDGEFDGRADDRGYAIARYREHNDDVQRSIVGERLLVFDVREGWEPLCRFLGVDIPPDTPFPHVNDRATMRRYVRLLKVVRFALPAALILATLVLLTFLLSGAS